MTTLHSLLPAIDTLSNADLEALQQHIHQLRAQRNILHLVPDNQIKVGLIADMHGDYYGFRQALAWLDQQGVSQILCLGDIVDRGPDADMIVRELKRRGIVCIAGNHDHTVLANQEKWRESAKPDRLRELGRIISDETAEFLQQLPATVRLTIGNQRLLLAHGTPWSDVLGIFPSSRVGLLEQLQARCGEDADIILLGHTHEPMCLRYGSLWILNPGSIYGVTMRDSHTCAILTLPALHFEVFDVKAGQVVVVPTLER